MWVSFFTDRTFHYDRIKPRTLDPGDCILLRFVVMNSDDNLDENFTSGLTGYRAEEPQKNRI